MTANTWRSWRLAYTATSIIAVAVLLILIPLGTLPYPPASDFSDAAVAHWPNAAFFRFSILEHHAWPLWNPLRLLGQPFAANPLSKVWYPPQWLVLLLPPTIHLNTLIYLHSIWLVLGMFLWAHRAGFRLFAGIAAAVGWLLAPKLIAHLGAGHLDLWYAAAWVPWLLWGILMLHQRGSIAYGALIGIIAAMLALADLRMAFYMLPVAAVYAALLAPQNNLRSQWRVWLTAALVFLGLTAVQVIPLLAISGSLTRSLITPDEAAAFSLPAPMLLGSIIPNIAGFHEWMTYLGIPAIALALIALRHNEKRIVVGMWVIAIIAALWAMGANVPLFLPIVGLVRAAAWFRVPSRAWFVVALAFALLSAYGIDVLLRRGLPKRTSMIAVATGFAGIVWLIASLRLALPDEARISVIAVGVLLLVTGLGLGISVTYWQHSKPASAAVLIASSCLSYLALDLTFVEAHPVSLTSGWMITDIQPCSLIYAPSFALLDPPAAHANIRTLQTADPFQLIWSASAVADAVNVPLTTYSITAPPIPPDVEDIATAIQNIPPNYDQLTQLGVTEILVPYKLPVYSTSGTLFSQDAGLYDYHLTGAGAPLGLCQPGPNRYETDFWQDTPREDGLIPLSMAWSLGWHAWVNGEPVNMQRVRGALIGVSVPDGTSGQIVLLYEPIADYIGMVVSAVTVLTLVIGWVIHRKASRNA